MRGIYAAPLEGVTGYVWRKAHADMFGGIDKYYTPFIAPRSTRKFQTREMRDITQNETGLVPQILAGNSELIIWAAQELAGMGYDEINLNFGCPNGTVVPKGKGSGALRDLPKLDAMLDDVYNALPNLKISIKTRIGLESADEWPAILEVYEKYPIYELTVHPRTQSQQYRGCADRELFKFFSQNTGLAIAYNGDVTDVDDEAWDYGCTVMVGRGLVANPALARMKRGGEKAGREELAEFHDRVMEGYREYLSGDVPLMHKMKELWFYYASNYEVDDSKVTRVLKAKRMPDYTAAANEIMRNCRVKELL